MKMLIGNILLNSVNQELVQGNAANKLREKMSSNLSQLSWPLSHSL